MLKFVLRAVCGLTLLPVLLFGAGKAEHVVLLVWDGMRPDFITPEHAPTLHALSQQGVFFANHHSVYCTATIVNGTALATGLYPHRHGVYANSIYLPDFQPLRPVGAQSMETVRHCDELSGGNYLVGPTIAEVLQAAGKRTAIAGSKTVALMHDRKPRANDQTNNITVFEGRTLPESYVEVLRTRHGQFPSAASRNSTVANEPRDQWTTSTLLESLWENGVPAFSLLWLSEPDFSQHAAGPGSPKALNALKSSDRRLAEVLAELDRRGVRDKTDIFIVSDHGFSTVGEPIDVMRILQNAGFSAQRSFQSAPAKGDILVVGLGGSVSFYVIERDEATVKKLVDFLQRQEFTGALFTRQKMEGAFTLEDAKINVPYPPDVVVSMKWSHEKSTIGVPGVSWSDGNPRRGTGNHASLSRFDVNNILVAAGPDLKRGFRSSMPSGNTDLAPTILWLLGHPSPKPMDGRVLSEAMAVDDAPPVSEATTRRVEAQRDLEGMTFRQYLKFSQVNNTVYLDEANSESLKK